jgi:predicted amidophosphoribosyltransferase
LRGSLLQQTCLSTDLPEALVRLVTGPKNRAVSFTPSPVQVWVAAAGDLLLGASCHGCGAAWWGVCPDCRQLLSARRPGWTRPDPCPAGFPPTISSSAYDPVLRGMINAHKERQALGLTGVLADRLAGSIHVLLTALCHSEYEPVVLVPVPSAARAVRRRGFDATLAMARSAARRLRVRYPISVAATLVQTRGMRDQAGLDAQARQANLAGGFRLRAPIPIVPTVLVDDLVTTGSSLSEAARALRRVGVPVLGAATVAATERAGQRDR